MTTRAAQILSFLQEQHRRMGYLPSQSEVAIRFDLKVSTVREKFIELVKAGHLVKERYKGRTDGAIGWGGFSFLAEYRLKEAG